MDRQVYYYIDVWFCHMCGSVTCVVLSHVWFCHMCTSVSSIALLPVNTCVFLICTHDSGISHVQRHVEGCQG